MTGSLESELITFCLALLWFLAILEVIFAHVPNHIFLLLPQRISSSGGLRCVIFLTFISGAIYQRKGWPLDGIVKEPDYEITEFLKVIVSR